MKNAGMTDAEYRIQALLQALPLITDPDVRAQAMFEIRRLRTWLELVEN